MLAKQGSTGEKIWLAGCDGGYQQKCTPTIWAFNTTDKKQGPAISLAVGESYTITAVFDSSTQGASTVRLRISSWRDAASLSELNMDFADTLVYNSKLGAVFGRNNVDTCVSNFTVETGLLIS